MRHLLETLEHRQHYSLSALSAALPWATPNNSPATPGREQPVSVTVPVAPQESFRVATKAKITQVEDEYNLSAAQVSQLLAQAASYMRDFQAVAITDREGVVLGVYATSGASEDTVQEAIIRARTAALFQSTQNAFTSRTARFIIQDHFPFPIRNTSGGPLYGVQFSSSRGSDILRPEQGPTRPMFSGLSGDPGGLPLYIGPAPAGGIGVAGDQRDVAPRENLAFPGQKVFNGREESDLDEAVAIAAVAGKSAPRELRIDARAPAQIQATRIFLPGPGLRFPYTASKPAKQTLPFGPLQSYVSTGRGRIRTAPTASLPNPYPKVDASVYGIKGEYKNTAQPGFGIVPSDDADASGAALPDSQKLTAADVDQIIRQAVQEALNVRAAIRLPIGTPAIVHITVVDRDGDLLGAFRMNDGTNFSFDVAVQKARTAAFFSDDTHAFSTRAIGFMSQKFFPSGIDGGSTGPLYLLQDSLTDDLPGASGAPVYGSAAGNPLANGITIFPGGVPLYKNGVLVGAIGISGDGVEQDDEIAFNGADNFQPRASIRSDALGRASIRDFIPAKVQVIEGLFNLGDDIVDRRTPVNFPRQAFLRLDDPFEDFSLPYVKFIRNSHIKD